VISAIPDATIWVRKPRALGKRFPATSSATNSKFVAMTIPPHTIAVADQIKKFWARGP
jgi:hypothetical protein